MKTIKDYITFPIEFLEYVDKLTKTKRQYGAVFEAVFDLEFDGKAYEGGDPVVMALLYIWQQCKEKKYNLHSVSDPITDEDLQHYLDIIYKESGKDYGNKKD